MGTDLEGVLGVELTGLGYGLDVEDEKKKRVKASPSKPGAERLFFLQYLSAPCRCPPTWEDLLIFKVRVLKC